MPQPFVGLLLQSFPLTEIAVPLETDLLPCSYPPQFQPTSIGALSPSVSRTPTLSAQLPCSPDDYELTFHAPKRASRSLWATDSRRPSLQLHLLRSLDPPASPFAPTRVAPRQWSLLSWTFPSPSETLYSLGASNPRAPRRALRTRPPPEGQACDPRDSSPWNRVSVTLARVRWATLVSNIQPPSGLGRAASRRRLLLPRPWSSERAAFPDPRSF